MSATGLGLNPFYGAFIDGEFDTDAEHRHGAVDPATGEHLADVARCDATDVDRAVSAAAAAFGAWSRTLPEERSRALHRIADLIEADAERLAQIDSRDVGRHIREMREDYRMAVEHFRYFASVTLAHEDFGRPIPGGYSIAKRVPLGVCGQIIPWNDPVVMLAFKLAPALAAGNTVVLKPDENASLATLEICKHLSAALPKGVVNVVPGSGEEVGTAITGDPRVQKLAFTGSTEVGRIIAAAAAQRLIPATLELGGKSPNIVFPDVDDIDAVVEDATAAVIVCNGQSCLAGTRLFVHEDIYEEFVPKLVEHFGELVVGAPLDENTDVSCMISARQGERVLAYIEAGRAEGARILHGGRRVEVPGCPAGYFIEPTIFEATNDMTIAQEEIFGPVLTVIKWNDYETMIAEANATEYGLASGIYTSNLRNAMETADRLDAGSVWVNRYANLHGGTPFGGFKDSGLGREYCRETLNVYSQLKSITFQGTTLRAHVK
ncbi:MAG: aldehyde dehydrogenase [Nocardia sp.]|uniref:aldehyde dehydrogenase family protein n=1 Tax=Nocardia sp. TaxID=1821 RepID=UPI0026076098|nr:aldehyde dehydrogenase family protein [Nocardia sp.]MCU1644975.1 aldehyde dehydrogenase [Nocardia sp.]